MPEMSTPYNPLDTENIGESLVSAMLRVDPVEIDQIPPFPGAGVYAIYYIGDFPVYAELASRNRDGQFSQPIYVGKAIPSGGRKGTVALGQVSGKYLFNRLKEHSESIAAAQNLDVADFYARWLVVEPIWIPLAESLMINRSACVWNAIVEGFGNHDPGKNRHGGKRTKWDTLHPGRWWAEKGTPDEKWTADKISQEAKTWISQRV